MKTIFRGEERSPDPSIDDRVEAYSNMWTTDLHRYGLLEADPPSAELGLVFDLEKRAPLVMDDDAEVVTAVFEKMRRAGVRRLTWEESAFKDGLPTADRE